MPKIINVINWFSGLVAEKDERGIKMSGRGKPVRKLAPFRDESLRGRGWDINPLRNFISNGVNLRIWLVTVTFFLVMVATPGSGGDIWVIDKRYLSPAERTFALTLQGLVAKERPAIWIRRGDMDAMILEELRQEGRNIHYENSVWQLLSLFRNHVNGAILYNLDTDSVNVATSLCGPMRAVAVDQSILGKAASEGLTVLLDVRGIDEVSTFTQYKDLFARGILVTQEERKNEHLRDLAVLRDAFTFYGVGAASTIWFVRELGPNPLVFGWEGEHEWIKQVSQGGGAGVPADWSLNLSTLSRLPVEIPRRPRRYPAPVQEGERIIAFVMSDGDNIQWMAGGFVNNTGFWASPHRGTFNMTWEMAPVFAEVAPRVLRHFYKTASHGGAIDDFVTGPSGAGYCYHNYLPDRRAFAEQTADYMRRSDLSIATVLNSGGDMTQTIEMLEQPEVMGILYKDYYPYNKRQGEIFWHNGKPCISYRYLLWENFGYDKTPEGVANAIATLPASPVTDQNSYAIINVHAWSFHSIGGPMEAVKRTIDRLPPNTRVVTAEELIVLLRNNFGSPAYEDPNGSIVNMTTGKRYRYIQHAIHTAAEGDEIVTSPGLYLENINFKGKNVTVGSTDPSDPAVVAATVINGGAAAPTVTFAGGEDTSCRLAGFTITGGNRGIYCSGASPTITDCTIAGSGGAGMESSGMLGRDSPTIINCTIAGNKGAGIEWQGRTYPTIINCTIAGNLQHGIFGGHPTITNCTIVGNALSGISCYKPTITNSILWDNSPEQIVDYSGIGSVTYSDIQGGYSGTGNIDEDPCFVDADSNDYHLLPDSACIDAGDPCSYFGVEPEPDGGRINMGAYGNTPEATCKYGLVLQSYNRVSRTRIGRTIFDYEFTVTLNNNSDSDVYNVQLELLDASSNVVIIDPVVSFAYIEAGQAATSEDTFALRVDRSVLIDATIISWVATFFEAGGGFRESVFTTNIILEPKAGDLSGDGVVDIEDLGRLAERWLWRGQPGDIVEDIVQDGVVNFADFGRVAENWQ